MTRIMTAAVLVENNKPLKLFKNINIPMLKKGQVLVKMQYAGLCHSQLMEIEGKRGEDKYLPHMLGHEGVGTVVEIGEGVTKVKQNDEVILGWIKGEGLECASSLYQSICGTTINAGAVTTFSEYTIVSENRLIKKPPHTPSEFSVLYGCAVPTGLGMVLNKILPEENPSVIFLGLGGIGLSGLLACKIQPFKMVIAIDINPEKLKLATELGASHTINPTHDNIFEVVKQLTDGVGVDYAFESAGTARTIEIAFELTRRGGKCYFASHPAANEKITLDPFELICGKKIEGSWGGGCIPDRDIGLFDQYYQKGLLPLNKLISKKYTLTNINEAVSDLQNKKIVRALIQCITV